MALAIDGTPVSAQGVFGGNPSNTVTMPNFSTTQAGDIVILTVNNASTAITSVTGSTLGAFTKIGSSSGGTPPAMEVYAAFASAALTNEVVSIVLASNFDPSFTLFAVSGSNQTSLTGAFETFIGNELGAFNGTMPQNFTTTNPDAMIIGAVATGFGAVPATPGTGFTFVGTPTGRLTTLYKVRSSIGTDSISTNEDNLAQAMVGFAVIKTAPSWSLIASHAQGAVGGTDFTTSAVDTTGADLVLVSFTVSNFSGSTDFVDAAISDNYGNTWLLANAHPHFNNANNQGTKLYYCQNPTVGAAHTFTTIGGGFCSLMISAWSGSAPSPLDVTSSDPPGWGPTFDVTDVTPWDDDTLCICHGYDNVDAPPTNDESYTVDAYLVSVGGNNIGGFIASKVQSTAAATGPVWTTGSLGCVGFAAFKKARSPGIHLRTSYSEMSPNSNGWTTAPIGTVGCDLLVVGIASTAPGAAASVTISDSEGNTWTALTAAVGGLSDRYNRLFYVTNPTVDAAHTFTLNGASSYCSMFIHGYAGVDTTSPFVDEDKAEVGYDTSATLGSVTATDDGSLFVTSLEFDTDTPAIDDGFTITEYTVGSGFAGPGALAYKVRTTAGAEAPTWTWASGSSRAAATIAVFKPAAGVSGDNLTAANLTNTAPVLGAPALLESGPIYTPSPALNADDSNENTNFRVLVQLEANSSGSLRVRFRANSAIDMQIAGASFGKWNGVALSASSCDMTTAPFRLTFNGGNNASGVVAAGSTITTDLIAHPGLTLNAGDWLIVSYSHTEGVGGSQRYSTGHTTATTVFKATGTDLSQAQTAAAMSNGLSIVGNVQPGGSGGSNYAIDLVSSFIADATSHTLTAANLTNTAPVLGPAVFVNTLTAAPLTNTSPVLGAPLTAKGAPFWAFVGISNVVEVTATGHTLVTTGISGTLQEGDLLIGAIGSRIASTTAMTLPSGGEWTKIDDELTNNVLTTTSAVASGTLAYAIRGASNPNFAFTHPTAPSVALGRLVAYRAVNGNVVYDTGVGATTATNVTSVSTTGLTTTKPEELIIKMAVGGQEVGWSAHDAATDPTTSSGTNSAQTANPIAGTWQERADSNTTTGADTSLAIADAIRATAGATGNLTATASAGASHVQIAGAFYFRATPAAAGLTNTAPVLGAPALGIAGAVLQTVNLVVISDSVMSTQDGTSMPVELVANLASVADITLTNLAVPGQTLPQQLTAYAAGAGAEYDGGFDRNILLIHHGSNDLLADNTLANWTIQAQTLIDNAVATGYEVVVTEAYHWDFDAFTGYLFNSASDYAAYNSIVRTRSGISAVINTSAIPELTNQSNVSNAPYYLDQEHLADDGAILWADFATPIMEALLDATVIGRATLTNTAPVLGAPLITKVLTAAALTNTAPVLGPATILQVHVLGAAALTNTAPVLGAPALGKVLSAAALTNTAPVLGAPLLTKVLSAAALTNTAPVLGPATMRYNLSAANLTNTAPVLGASVTLGQRHVLTAAALTNTAPVLGAPTMGAAGDILAAALTNTSPVLGPATIGQKHVLTAAALTNTAPVLGPAQAGYNLAPAALTNTAPVLGPATIGQRHALTAAALTNTSPVLPGLSLGGSMAAAPLTNTAPVLGPGTIGQVHVLTGAGLTNTAPVLPALSLSGQGALLPAALTNTSPDLGTATIGQRHVLAAATLVNTAPVLGPAQAGKVLPVASLTNTAPVLGPATIRQAHALEGSLTNTAPTLGTPTLGQRHVLTAAPLTNDSPVLPAITLGVVGVMAAAPLVNTAPILGPAQIAQIHVLGAAGLTNTAPALGAPTFIQVVSLPPAGLENSAPVLGAPALGQRHVLGAAGLTNTAPTLPGVQMIPGGVMAAFNLSNSSPLLGMPEFRERYTLVAGSLVNTSPVLGPVRLPARLVAAGFVNSAPVIPAGRLNPRYWTKPTALQGRLKDATQLSGKIKGSTNLEGGWE